MITDQTKKIFVGSVLLLLIITVILAVLLSLSPQRTEDDTQPPPQSGDEVFDYNQRIAFDRVALRDEVESLNDLLLTPTNAQEISHQGNLISTRVSSLNTVVTGLETNSQTEPLKILYLDYIGIGESIVDTTSEIVAAESNPTFALDRIDEFHELRNELIIKEIEILEQTNIAGEEAFIPSSDIETLRNLLNK